jgi:hypothetical protein
MTPRQLKARFPYQFAGANIGFAFHRGWMPLFIRLCEDVDALLGENKGGFHWVQLKEKFGSARWYWQMDGGVNVRIDVIGDEGVASISKAGSQEALWQRLGELIHQAEAQTQSRCIACGEPGKQNRDEPWVLVLCDEHARQRRRGKLGPCWLAEEDE